MLVSPIRIKLATTTWWMSKILLLFSVSIQKLFYKMNSWVCQCVCQQTKHFPMKQGRAAESHVGGWGELRWSPTWGNHISYLFWKGKEQLSISALMDMTPAGPSAARPKNNKRSKTGTVRTPFATVQWIVWEIWDFTLFWISHAA